MLELSHKKLAVYTISLQLVEEVYKITRSFPKEEQFSLTIQLRRAAISVCSNIAEGASRLSKQEKKRFYEIARGSAVEIDTQFEIALRLLFVRTQDIKLMEYHLESVFRILSTMIKNLNSH